MLEKNNTMSVEITNMVNIVKIDNWNYKTQSIK